MSETESVTGAQDEQPPSIGVYEGPRSESGERHGEGRTVFSNGDTFEGTYVNGQRCGKGVYTWKSVKARFVGNYDRNARNGLGTFVYPDKSYYTGEFMEGYKHGSGTYTYTDKSRFVGMWVKDLKHGVGTYTTLGTEIKGTWDQNYLLGHAVIKHADHTVEGTFKHVYAPPVTAEEAEPAQEDSTVAQPTEIIHGTQLEVPCKVTFSASQYTINEHWVTHQLGLGPNSALQQQEV